MTKVGTKRATSAAATSPKKKGRVDPMFAGIVATLEGADDLSEKCRQMLVEMAKPCLSTPKSERHSLQQLGVTMIEEKLQDHKKKLIEAVELAQKELNDLEGSKSTLEQNLERAKASLEEKRTSFLAAYTAREDAKTAVKAAEGAVAEAKAAQKTGDANHAAFLKEKEGIDAVYQEHFKAPMDADEAPHFSFLKPFIATLGLEDSLANALPSSCVKPKEQRGGFDNLVLEELGKALVGRIAFLTKSIAGEATAVSERSANVVSAEADLEAKNLVEKTASSSLEAAATVQHAAEADVRQATEEWTSFQPRVQEATDKHNLEDTKRMDFEEGALKDFCNFRDKEVEAPVEEEAAPGGA